MKTVSYNVRLEEDIKEKAVETFSAVGLTLSQAINVFLKKAIEEKGIPFEVKARKHHPSVYEDVAKARKQEGGMTLEELKADMSKWRAANGYV